VNSWLLKLDQVSTGEAAEVMAINALAPFIINGRLRGLMERTPSPEADVASESAAIDARKWPKFIVNVSAMVHVLEMKQINNAQENNVYCCSFFHS